MTSLASGRPVRRNRHRCRLSFRKMNCASCPARSDQIIGLFCSGNCLFVNFQNQVMLNEKCLGRLALRADASHRDADSLVDAGCRRC